jgi:HK97 family phage prohead protease
MTNTERRQTREAVTLRAAGSGGEQRIGGYAAKFNTLSQNLGGFVERIAPGFFNSSRDAAWRGVMARYNHDLLLGTTAAGSLRLGVDGTGLDYEVDLLDDADSQRVLKLVQRGDVSQSSFAFYVAEDEWSTTDNGFPLRTLVGGTLVDVAPVDQPAYLDTSTGLRSLAEARGIDIAEVEALARANDLAKILSAPPVVIDLGATDSTPAERGETCGSAVRLEQLRRALEEKKAV